MATEHHRIHGPAAPLDIANLDTDQIMPKQFLRGIDKAGLDQGLLWDLRFHPDGTPRPAFVLNRPAFAGTRVLVAGPNFGCGSSREHAVWGLLQYGIQAVVAPSFGEIFYSNAMNSGLLAVQLAPDDAAALLQQAMAAAQANAALLLDIDIAALRVQAADFSAAFTLSDRHRSMFLQGVDMLGATLAHQAQIDAFAQRHWAAKPWLKDVAVLTKQRLDATPPTVRI